MKCEGPSPLLGDYAINPLGVWHPADVSASATAVFVTAGMGPEVREP